LEVEGCAEFCGFTIYDLSGKQVLTGLFSPGNAIDIIDLKSGFYTLKLNNSSLKFIKE
jgi:myo-inositol-hexaphosphate 3-phosphohydrolase